MLPLSGLGSWGLLGLCLLHGACRASPQPGAGTASQNTGERSLDASAARRLHGRFLHITDVHPDPFYKTYSSTEENAACHRKHGPAGIYGAETSACDSPVSLVDETFRWIDENLKDTIDFVVWTGDSARHDNDEKIPRTEKQVVEQNELLVRKFRKVFGKPDDGGHGRTSDFTIPIVPTFGNNDIMPHNIFLEGPNKWTLKYLDVWRNFIPEAQKHSFHQGGWFYVEVIPGSLAVFSLNTIYFFDSNSAVDGCANKHEPGYQHMEWLRIQLQIMRERGLKVILMGHVPPARVDSKESWDETCWQKYTFWLQQYRDIIVGSLFGHMNIDHFMLHDFDDITKETKSGKMASAGTLGAQHVRESMYDDGEVTVASASDYLIDLREAWAKLPSPPPGKGSSRSARASEEEDEALTTWDRVSSLFSSRKQKQVTKDDKKKYLDKIGGKYGERYSIALVAPSVVPNYFPALRVFEYNITGLEDLLIPADNDLSAEPHSGVSFDGDLEDGEGEAIIEKKKKKKEKDRSKKPKKYKFKIPKGPSKTSPPGPAYSMQPFTLLGYTQWYANLTHINNDFVEPSSLTRRSPRLDPAQSIFGLDVNEDGSIDPAKWKEGKHGKHQGKKPRPEPHPKEFKFEVEYTTMNDKKGFGLKDLTVRNYVKLARKIGAHKSKSLTVGEEFEDEEEGDDFGEQGKKHKKKKGKHAKNHAWFTFVKRAFVGTMDPKDIEETFGKRDFATNNPAREEQEVMEL